MLYLLHGCCDTYQSWTRKTDMEELRALRGVLVVMPEAGQVGWYRDWGVGGSDRVGLRLDRRLVWWRSSQPDCQL